MRISYTSRLLCTNQAPLNPPRPCPPALPHPGAILLHDHCEVYDSPPFVCCAPYNIGNHNLVLRRRPPHTPMFASSKLVARSKPSRHLSPPPRPPLTGLYKTVFDFEADGGPVIKKNAFLSVPHCNKTGVLTGDTDYVRSPKLPVANDSRYDDSLVHESIVRSVLLRTRIPHSVAILLHDY